MLFRTLLFFALAMQPAFAKSDIGTLEKQYRERVTEMRNQKDAWLSLQNARTTLKLTFEAGGVEQSMNYVGDWGSDLYLKWSAMEDVYGGTLVRLREWRGAVRRGLVKEETAIIVVSRAMARMEKLNHDLDFWYREDIRNYLERALWLDLRAGTECCGPEYEFYSAMADRAFADTMHPEYGHVRNIVILPPAPWLKPGSTDYLGKAKASLRTRILNIAPGDRAAILGAIFEARTLLEAEADEETAALRDVLRILEERLGLARAPVVQLLEQAALLRPGPLRAALLKEAQHRLMARAGHLAPIIAAGAKASDDPAAVERARTLILHEAKRLAMLHDDYRGFLNTPSAALRYVAGMNAASGLLDFAQSGTVSADQAAGVINDISDSMSSRVSPTAPFAGPMGVVTGQLDNSVAAMGETGNAMDAVAAAVGGDEAALERAIESGERLEELIDPRRYVESMAKGFVEGVLSNVPFARSIFDLIIG